MPVALILINNCGRICLSPLFGSQSIHGSCSNSPDVYPTPSMTQAAGAALWNVNVRSDIGAAAGSAPRSAANPRRVAAKVWLRAGRHFDRDLAIERRHVGTRAERFVDDIDCFNPAEIAD